MAMQEPGGLQEHLEAQPLTTAHPINMLMEGAGGIAATDINKLIDAGFHTVESIAHAAARRLRDVKGITDPKIAKLKAAGTRRHPPCPARR